MVFRSRRMAPVTLSPTFSGGNVICQVPSHKHLGLVFHELLSWHNHVNYLSLKISQRLGLLMRLRRRLPSLTIRQLYVSCIRPTVEYAFIAWCGLQRGDQDVLDRLQRRAVRLITNLSSRSDTPHEILLARAGLDSLASRRQREQRCFMYWPLHKCLPSHLQLFLEPLLSSKSTKSLSLRNSLSVRLPRAHKNILSSSPLYVCSSSWNSLPSSAQQSASLSKFKSFLDLLF